MRRLLRKSPYKKLEKALGYTFRRSALLETALTHRSFRFESNDVETDNQRMEFLGDAVLGFVAGAHLYKRFEDSQEGALTRTRSHLTSGRMLAQIGRNLDIGQHLRIGRGEEKLGGRRRASNLSDAIEAVIGAAYLDGGVRACEKIFRTVFLPELQEEMLALWTDNPKGELQQIAQSRWKEGPEYRCRDRTGPAHAKTFTAEVLVHGKVLGKGQGRTKRAAETEAAIAAIRRLSPRRSSRRRRGRAKREGSQSAN